VAQLDAEALEEFGFAQLKHDILANDDDDIRLLMNKEPQTTLYWETQNLFDIIGIGYQWSSQLHLWLGSHAGAADATDRKLTGFETGHALHATWPVIFGNMVDPDTWFDPKSYGKLEAILTQATASGVCSVVAEQVRSM
jgi:hypothetical protein